MLLESLFIEHCSLMYFQPSLYSHFEMKFEIKSFVGKAVLFHIQNLKKLKITVAKTIRFIME